MRRIINTVEICFSRRIHHIPWANEIWSIMNTKFSLLVTAKQKNSVLWPHHAKKWPANVTTRRKIYWKERKKETTNSVNGQHQGMDETVLCRMCRKADNREKRRSMIVDLLRADDTR